MAKICVYIYIYIERVITRHIFIKYIYAGSFGKVLRLRGFKRFMGFRDYPRRYGSTRSACVLSRQLGSDPTSDTLPIGSCG